MLSAIAIADELSNTGVVPVLCKDNLGTSVFFSASAWVRKMPTASFSKEIGDDQWILDA